jgi:hypothetical protein
MIGGEDLGTTLAGLARASRNRLAEHFGMAPPARTSPPPGWKHCFGVKARRLC